jgi:flagellar basal-body rod protein FlgB
MDINTKNTELLMRLMDASSQRRDVLITNLANAETPGFQRKTVQFEDLLQNALKRGQDPSNIQPKVDVDLTAMPRDDGNTVDLEQELNGLRENRLLYESYAAMLDAHFDILRTAIDSGR